MSEHKSRGRPRKYANNEEKNKIYYQQRREEIIQKVMEYHRKNYATKIKELQHQYYLRHRDERLQYQHKYIHKRSIIDSLPDNSLDTSDDSGSGLLDYYESKIC
jgi:hypothetical protein